MSKCRTMMTSRVDGNQRAFEVRIVLLYPQDGVSGSVGRRQTLAHVLYRLVAASSEQSMNEHRKNKVATLE